MGLPRPNFDKDENVLVAFGLTAGVAAVLVALAVLVFVLPDTETKTTTLATYEHTGRFNYTVTADPSPLNPSGTIGPVRAEDTESSQAPQPIFTQLARLIDFSYVYQLDGASEAIGTLSADLEIKAGQSWSTRRNLVPEMTFDNTTAAIVGAIDLVEIGALLGQVEEQTGVNAGNVELTIIPVVQLEAIAGGEQITETYSSPLTFTYSSTLITPGPSLAFNDPGTLSSSVTTDKEVSLIGSSIRIADLRPIVPPLAFVFLAISGLFAAIYFLGFGRGEAGVVRSRYRSLQVPILEVESAVSHRIAVKSIHDLAHMAKHEGRSLFVRDFDNGSQAYLVHDGMVIYHYAIGDVPTDWIKTPGALTGTPQPVVVSVSTADAKEPLAVSSEDGEDIPSWLTVRLGRDDARTTPEAPFAAEPQTEAPSPAAPEPSIPEVEVPEPQAVAQEALTHDAPELEVPTQEPELAHAVEPHDAYVEQPEEAVPSEVENIAEEAEAVVEPEASVEIESDSIEEPAPAEALPDEAHAALADDTPGLEPVALEETEPEPEPVALDEAESEPEPVSAPMDEPEPESESVPEPVALEETEAPSAEPEALPASPTNGAARYLDPGPPTSHSPRHTLGSNGRLRNGSPQPSVRRWLRKRSGGPLTDHDHEYDPIAPPNAQPPESPSEDAAGQDAAINQDPWENLEAEAPEVAEEPTTVEIPDILRDSQPATDTHHEDAATAEAADALRDSDPATDARIEGASTAETPNVLRDSDSALDTQGEDTATAADKDTDSSEDEEDETEDAPRESVPAYLSAETAPSVSHEDPTHHEDAEDAFEPATEAEAFAPVAASELPTGPDDFNTDAAAEVEEAVARAEMTPPSPPPRQPQNLPLERKLANQARKWLRDFLEYQSDERTDQRS